MPPVKKAAKSAASKHTPQEDAAKDTRRAYEHLGRVEVLHASLDHAATEITQLTELAQQRLNAGHGRDAADLLRAAEHLSFGALSSPKKDAGIERELLDAITKEFDHKLDKAEEHWSKDEEHHAMVELVYEAVTGRARKAFDAGAYRKALELARGAEALAHVPSRGVKQLSAAATQHQLTN
ncbi:MAG: hypothetical protein ACRYF4_01240 [Janthinobacterium lividum]